MSEPEENPLEMQVNQALVEYLDKCDSGVMPDREEFLSRHPELREQLTELLSAADWIEQLAGPTLADLAREQDTPGSSQLSYIEETLPLRPKPSFSPLTSEAGNLTVPEVSPRNFASLNAPREKSPGGSGKADIAGPVLPCKFGDYILERVLGRGGMGVVYYGHQVHLQRPAAIKMIRSGALASREEVQRFYAEARSAARLDHPNIVSVHQCGEQDGHHYFSMDFVDGQDLAAKIKDEPIDCKTAARYVRDVARAIQYAHERGILHRDLKPANVLVDEDGNVHVTDFGLAKIMENESGLTASGAALGTPSYMSPEQAAGNVEQHMQATDIYSMGAILFTIVTGQPPFKAESIVQTIMHVIHRPAPAARTINPNVDEDLATIIDVCLQKSADRRYASAAALADDLDRYLRGVPIEARPVSRLRRAWYWLLGVPIFGAVLDHRVVEPTEAHRWVQRGLISAGILLLVAWVMLLIPSSVWYRNRMPTNVRMAAGLSGGDYESIAKALCDSIASTTKSKATVLSTVGSHENAERLFSGEADLALMQADNSGAKGLCVVAPLFYEAVHVLVDAELPIESIRDFAGRRVLMGALKSGSRSVALKLFAHAGLAAKEVTAVDGDWRALEKGTADAAVVVAKVGSPEILRLLAKAQYRLLQLSDAWEFSLEEPSFHPIKLGSDYAGPFMPEYGIATVAIPAFLVARQDAPNVLIEKVLEVLYVSELAGTLGIFDAERAAHWQGLNLHPAARSFFDPYRGGGIAGINLGVESEPASGQSTSRNAGAEASPLSTGR